MQKFVIIGSVSLWITSGCVALPTTDLDGGVGGASSTTSSSNTGGATATSSTSGTSSNSAADANGDASTTCDESFEPCGGDPTGTWDVVNVCVQGDIVAAANAAYASDSTSCSGLCKSVSLSAQGSVTYDSGSYEPSALTSISETLTVTSSCFAALSGESWTNTSCTTFAQLLESDGNTTAVCSQASAGCNCVYTTNSAAQGDTYTVSGSSLVASDGTTTEFCVQGSTMVQRDKLTTDVYVLTQFSKR